MITLRKLFGRDDRFFNLLEASAKEARHSVCLLGGLLRDRSRTQALADIVEVRRKERLIHAEIREHVIRSFVTSLEREDIEALSYALYRIPKNAEKFAERFELCSSMFEGVDFRPHAEPIEQAADHVLGMVTELRRGGNLDSITEHNNTLVQIERSADNTFVSFLQSLHRDTQDVLKIIALRDLCRILERIIARYAEAADVVTHVVLKHA